MAERRKRLADLRDQLAVAEADDRRLWKDALAAGWSRVELRASGLSEPSGKVTRRRTPAAKKPGRTIGQQEKRQQWGTEVTGIDPGEAGADVDGER